MTARNIFRYFLNANFSCLYVSFSKSWNLHSPRRLVQFQLFKKTHSCKLIPNWIRNRMISYTSRKTCKVYNLRGCLYKFKERILCNIIPQEVVRNKTTKAIFQKVLWSWKLSIASPRRQRHPVRHTLAVLLSWKSKLCEKRRINMDVVTLAQPLLGSSRSASPPLTAAKETNMDAKQSRPTSRPLGDSTAQFYRMTYKARFIPESVFYTQSVMSSPLIV